MIRNLMWINEESGYIAFDVTFNGEHQYYEYLKFGKQNDNDSS